MTTNEFTTELTSRLSEKIARDRTIFIEVERGLSRGPTGGSVYVTFVNLPTPRVRERRGGGAESENNRMLFSVRGFSSAPAEDAAGSVVVEQLVNNVGPIGAGAPKLRKKTGDPARVAAYLADYLNRVTDSHEPQFTHE